MTIEHSNIMTRVQPSVNVPGRGPGQFGLADREG